MRIDNLQKTPLHYATANGHTKIVNALLVKGANVYEERMGNKRLLCIMPLEIAMEM